MTNGKVTKMPDRGSIGSIEDLQKLAQENATAPVRKSSVFIALPNLGPMVAALSRRLLDFCKGSHAIAMHYQTGNRHHDFARNQSVKEFLRSNCEWLLFIDSDVVPPPETVDTLVALDKDIIAGSVFCYVKDALLPSIWINADCEQCVCVKAYCETGEVHDPTQYQLSEDGQALQRWNPFTQSYGSFADRNGLLENCRCRCKGTGKDPWVFRVHPDVVKFEPFQCDSLGAACMLIRRSVIEKMAFPWFRHLYKASGEIMLTEDHFFCWRAKEMGLSIWAHPQVVCSHMKEMDLLAVNNLMVKAHQIGIEEGKRQAAAAAPVPNDPVPIPTAEDIAAQW